MAWIGFPAVWPSGSNQALIRLHPGPIKGAAVLLVVFFCSFPSVPRHWSHMRDAVATRHARTRTHDSFFGDPNKGALKDCFYADLMALIRSATPAVQAS